MGSEMCIRDSDNGGFAKATDNSPLRANKGSNYEGGIRVPVLMHWPGHIEPGSICREPVISNDFYPTILEATGIEPKPFQHLDGMSLMPLFSGDCQFERDALFWHYPHYNQHPQSFPSGVIRNGDWKLIENFETGDLQLYNLAKDLGETQNVAQQNPQLTANLLAKLKRWRNSVNADPMQKNPQFGIKKKDTEKR